MLIFVQFSTLGVVGQQIDTECPKDVCILSNTFCNESKIGDGLCQDYNNSEYCQYDGGDCCLQEKGSECCHCSCRSFWFNQDYDIGTKPGFGK